MVDIKKYYLYCMGEGWLDRRKYYNDVGHERMQNRVQRDHMEHFMRLAQQPVKQPVQNPLNPFNTLFPQPTWIQRGILTLLKPVQVMVLFLRNMMQRQPQANTQQPQMRGTLLERLISQTFAFFFWNKKDKVDEKEKEKRHLQDMNDPETHSKRTVESSNGSSFGSNQR